MVIDYTEHHISIMSCRAALLRSEGKTRKELIFSIVLIAAVALFASFLILHQRSDRKITIVKEGDRAPSFDLPSIDHRRVGLSDYKGKIVLVHFWATWCPPCVEEMPRLEQLYRTFSGRDFEILAVSVDEGGEETVLSFLRRNRVSFPVLINPGGAVASRYGTFKFPETYVVDRKGIVRYKVIGPLDWMTAETVTALSRLVEER